MNNVKFPCPGCGKQIVAPESLAGKRRTCPRCGTGFTVPAMSPSIGPPKKSASTASAGSAAPPPVATEHPLLLLPPRSTFQGELIDMTAMVDIVFFILIFFMVTSLQALEAVIGLPSPEAQSANAIQTAPSADDPGFVTVTIEGDDTVWLEDEEVFGEQDLRIKLRQLRKDDPDLSGLMVVGNPEASHGALVMVLDAGADAGMGEIRFSVSEQPDF
jgi:biopolymer transport protein ExbD